MQESLPQTKRRMQENRWNLYAQLVDRLNEAVGERRKRRSKSAPVKKTHLDDQQRLETIGTIRLVSPDRTSDFSDRGYASQTSVARLSFDEPDVMDTDDVETIGVLRLVSPQTSPRPV